MAADRGRTTRVALIGVSAGVTAVAAWAWWRRIRPSLPVRRGRRPRGPAGQLLGALQRDLELASRRIDVGEIADGVVELRGSVADRAEAERAIGIAQATSGVYTVVNRLRLSDEEGRRDSARRRWRGGAPDLHESRHYGMGVGMGRRRQSRSTDPSRPSDRQQMLERELDVAKLGDEPQSRVHPISRAEAVENADVKPGDERAMREAGLDASPRPNSTPKRSVEPEEVEGGER